MSTRRGVWILVLLFTVVGGLVLFAAIRLRGGPAPVPASTVLVFDVPSDLQESEVPLEPFSFDFTRFSRTTLYGVVRALDDAASDDRVAALVLHIDGIDWGWAKIGEVRDALQRFRASGKPVYASMPGGGESEYFLASVATRVSMPPTAMLQLDGLTASALFLKGSLDKLDIRPNFEHAGRFKSAVESYTRSDMSPEHRLALDGLLDDQFTLLVDSLASARGMSPDSMRARLDEGPFLADQARSRGLLDTLLDHPETDSLAMRDVGHDATRLSLAKYAERKSAGHTGPHLALITATGTIFGGKSRFVPGEGRVMGSETMIEALRDARTDHSIKAVVLRIDSPGGDVTASDDVWREVRRCRAAKPVIVSMSDVAASGGYYIACAADRIVAQPGTLTGSIGVFGGKLNLIGLYHKLGINVETVSRGRHAGMMSPFRDFSPEEAQRFRDGIEHSYQRFLSRVSEGRRLTVAMVDSVGQGRVWSGQAAHRLGLVDTLGGLREAFAVALEKSGYSADQEFVVERLPRVEHPFIERVVSEWIDRDDDARVSEAPFSEVIQAWITAARFPSGAMLALMPYSIEIR
jgi:protease-4